MRAAYFIISLKHLIRKNQEFWNHERSLTALLVYTCLALIFWIGLGNDSQDLWAFAVGDLLFNLIILAGVFAVFTQWRKQFWFITIAIGSGVFRIVVFIWSSMLSQLMCHVLSIAFFVLLARMVLNHIFKDGPMNFYRIQGSVVVFLIIGIVYAMIYTIIHVVTPEAFHVTIDGSALSDEFSQFLYLSFVTITTLGIGDMFPVSPLAKALVVFESMIGLLYPVIMIARLVSIEVNNSGRSGKSS
jgi:hypothetical protein